MSDKTYLIRNAEIDAMEGLNKTHFLNAEAKRNNKSLGDAAGLGFHVIEVAPGCGTAEHHVHYHEDECVYVLSGTATAFIGEETVQIEAGDFIGCRKGGLAHSIKNTGSENLRCIVVGERRGHDVIDYPKLNKRLYRNAGLEWNLVDMDNIEKPEAGAK